MIAKVSMALASLFVVSLFVGFGCASSEPQKRDYPDEPVGGPPSSGPNGGGPRAQVIGEADFPSDHCEKIYRTDREKGTRCFHKFFIDRVQASDPAVSAAFWPEAQVVIQVTAADGKTEVVELDGIETGRRLKSSLESGISSGIVKMAAEEERVRAWEVVPLEDGTVRLHQEEKEDAGSWKADYYVAMVDDELKYVRLSVVMYVDAQTIR